MKRGRSEKSTGKAGVAKKAKCSESTKRERSPESTKNEKASSLTYPVSV